MIHCVSLVELSYQLISMTAVPPLALTAVATQFEGGAGATASASSNIPENAIKNNSQKRRTAGKNIKVSEEQWVARRKISKTDPTESIPQFHPPDTVATKSLSANSPPIFLSAPALIPSLPPDFALLLRRASLVAVDGFPMF